MKCVAVVIIAVSFICCQATMQEVRDLEKKVDESLEICKLKNKLTDEQIRQFEKLSLPLDKSIQCTIACVAKQMDIMRNGDNTLDSGKIASIIKIVVDNSKNVRQQHVIKNVTEILDICMPLHKGNNDECVSANSFAECLIENGKKNGLIVPPKQ